MIVSAPEASAIVVLSYPYWEHRDPLSFPVQGSYADPTAEVKATTEHGWDHSLGEIVTALIEAGLEIRSLREYPFVDWKLDFLEERGDVLRRLLELQLEPVRARHRRGRHRAHRRPTRVLVHGRGLRGNVLG